MAEPDPRKSSDATQHPIWLPSPGCLLAVTLLAILACTVFGFGWRGNRQRARLAYFEELGGEVESGPAWPVWLHDLVVATLGEEHAAGFTDVTKLHLDDTQVTDTGLRHLRGLTNLQELSLWGTQITDDGLHYLSDLRNLESLSLGSNRSQPRSGGICRERRNWSWSIRENLLFSRAWT